MFSMLSDLTNYFLTLLQTNQTALQLADIWDGDMSLIPRTPCVAVIAGQKVRELRGAPIVTQPLMTVYLMVYHNKVQDVQTNYREAILRGEAIEALINADVSLGGNVVFGMVTTTEPGFSVRSNSVLRTSRLTWEGQGYVVGAV